MSEADQFIAQAAESRRARPPDDDLVRPAPRPGSTIGLVNWIGVRTLCAKEISRFLKVFTQTVVAPTVTTLLFMAIFALALGGAVRVVNGVPFLEFLAPGLIMMAMVQNAFANTSSSLMIGKVQGSIVDLLMPPLSPAELTFAFVVGGMARGLMVGAAVLIAVSFVVPIRVQDWPGLVFFAVSASVMLSLMGLIAAIWADKFDHMAAITNFVVTPLAFLSGTFYSVERLPGIWYTVSQLNPFFYMIDGFRAAVIGRADGSVLAGVIVLSLINGALWWLTVRMFATGYKLKE